MPGNNRFITTEQSNYLIQIQPDRFLIQLHFEIRFSVFHLVNNNFTHKSEPFSLEVVKSFKTLGTAKLVPNSTAFPVDGDFFRPQEGGEGPAQAVGQLFIQLIGHPAADVVGPALSGIMMVSTESGVFLREKVVFLR